MSEIPFNAPGCFGSALAYQPNHAFCQSCVFKAECEPLHLQNLASLRAQLGVNSLGRKAKSVVTSAAQPVGTTLPKKVQELVDRLDAAKLDVIANLKAKQNPFGQQFPYLRVAAHLLLNFAKPVNKDLMQAAFIQQFKWSDETAAAHVRMTFQALTHIGAVDDIDNAIKLREA